jgi:2,4-dienoyl-CoA reductase-like NADH-dependent reductase (Old Yellow Enzyme family)
VAALQIVHGGRQSNPKITKETPMAPSAVEDTSSKIVPREMMAEDIERVISQFADAAVRAREAGFDAVQFHGAHGYLLSQFISPYTNQRTDEWGGSTEGRCRIIIEILKRTRNKAGEDFPEFIKLNTTDGLDHGLTYEEAAKAAALLTEAGIVHIETSGGIAEAGAVAAQKSILKPEQEAYFGDAAKLVKEKVGDKAVVALVGGVRSLEVMNRIINDGTADMISLSRPLIREPHLVKKFKDGEKTKADCISCNGCYNPRGVRCVVISKK